MKAYGIARTALYAVIAALVIVFADTLVEHIKYTIGTLMILYGVEETVYTAFKEKKHYNIRALYWNLVEILMGCTLIFLVGRETDSVPHAVICTCWATWSILREARELMEATEEIKHSVTAIPNIVESLVVIGFSISMIVEPTEHHAKIHMYLLSVEMVCKVLLPAIDYTFRKYHRGHAHGEVIEAIPPTAEEPAAQAEPLVQTEPLAHAEPLVQTEPASANAQANAAQAEEEVAIADGE